MEIYKKVQQACKEKGLTILALETKLGYSRGSICKWDAHSPSVKKVAEVAKELEKPLEFFVDS